MNNKQENNQNSQDSKAEVQPNESGGFYFSSFLKITDPNTSEVLVQTRGDN